MLRFRRRLRPELRQPLRSGALTQIYERTVKPLVDYAFQGAKVSCFAYGQTGSGKTYTMIGDYNDGKQVDGLYVLASHDIFAKLAQPANRGLRVFVSFYEIYCGKLYDLLNKRAKLDAREDAKQNVPPGDRRSTSSA